MQEESFDLKEILQKYYKYWPLFIFSISVAMLIAFIVNLYTPLQYRIESKFLIKEEESVMNLFDFGPTTSNGSLPRGQKIANESIRLKSREIAEKTLMSLPFQVEYYEDDFFVPVEIYEGKPIIVEVDWSHPQLVNGWIKISWQDDQSFRFEYMDNEYKSFIPGMEKPAIMKSPASDGKYSFNEWVENPYTKLKVTYTSDVLSGTVLIKLRDMRSLIDQYTSDELSITSADKTSSILSLTLETTQPQKGRDYLNTLMDVYLRQELNEKNNISRNTIEFIDSQLSGISDSLSFSEYRLQNFRKENRTNNLSLEGTAIFEELATMEKSLSENEFKKEYYKNLQNYLVREEYTDIVMPSGIGVDDPMLNKLIEELTFLQSEKARLLSTQTENSPPVVEVNRKLNQHAVSIREVLKNVSANTSMIIDDLKRRISRIEAQFGKLPETEQDLLNIKRKYSLNENIYTFLIQRRSEAAIQLASNKPNNKISEPAVLTFEPVRLKRMLSYFLAVVLGLVVPISIIFIIDIFSVKIVNVKELEQNLKVPLLGCIGHNALYAPLVVLNHPNSSITESFRALRTNIGFILPKGKPITVMVTSSIAGEGKSFCAMNLASVYCIGEKRTLLIGCDMHKSFRFGAFKNAKSSGLSNYLSGQEDSLSLLIQKTENKDLDVLLPGPVPPNPAELLISNKFEKMIAELRDMYDVIVLDSSPLGLMNEALYLTQLADVTVFLLRQKVSRKDYVDDINDLKEKKGIKNLYAVLNDVEDKYLKHHGYGYGYYYEDQKRSISLKNIFTSKKS